MSSPSTGSRSLSNLHVFAFVWRQWMRRPRMFAAVVVFVVASTLSDLMVPIFAGKLVDALAQGPGAAGRDSAWAAYALFLGFAVGFHFFRQTAVRFFEVPMSVRNMEDMVNEAFATVQGFSADWHANTFAGAVVRRVSRGMWAYDDITSNLVLGLAPTLMVLFGLCFYMLAAWPLVGLYGLAVLIAFMILNVLMATTYIRPANQISQARDSAIGAALADAVGSIGVVKTFGAEAREADRFAATTRAWRTATQRTWMRFVNTWLVQIVAVLALQAGLVGLLVHLWASDQASPGDVAFAISAFLMMSGYLRRFGEEVQRLQRALDEIEDIAIYARTTPQIADAADAKPFAPGPGAIAFERVTFTYAGQTEPLYRDFSLTIAPGERVALVGPTGSGKSTFVKLVQRLYDVGAGAVTIDGQDVRAVTQTSLRRAIALVPQDPALFHRSIAENIAYANPDAARDDIVAAAHRARAHGFIAALPNGYDTLVGERGVKLSGGERQRVALARALLADAPILILDEATSSLDGETERQIQEAMEELMRGRTSIVIAHRLSTIRDADRILVFDRGRIVEQGTHADLVARGGVYARLHARSEG